MFLSLSSLSAVFTFFLLAVAHPPHHAKRHSEIARKLAENTTSVEKRWPNSFTNARATWYDVGLGACGKVNVPSDYIVALNAPMYGSGYPGPMCWKMITITCNGHTATAQIVDECMGCPSNGGIDMSKGLFQHFADLGAGILSCDWFFDDGSGSSGGGGDDPKPTHTSTKHTTSHTPTSTWQPPPPKTTSHKTTSTSHSQPTAHSTTHTSTSTSQTPTPTYSGPNNLQNVLEVVDNIANVLLKVAA